jgi:hypothetical protein
VGGWNLDIQEIAALKQITIFVPALRVPTTMEVAVLMRLCFGTCCSILNPCIEIDDSKKFRFWCD